jgi:hypothetical protein
MDHAQAGLSYVVRPFYRLLARPCVNRRICNELRPD